MGSRFQSAGSMLNGQAVFEDKQRWLARLMLAAGGLLVVFALARGIAAWQRAAADRRSESVPVLEAGVDGFLPMLADGASSDTRMAGSHRPSGLLAPDGDPPAQDSPAAVPAPAGDVPIRLVIPKIGLEAPIVGAGLSMVTLAGQEYYQWEAPNFFAAGWHRDTALLDAGGNTVLDGHHNVDGEVFRDLHLLEPGDLIVVFGQNEEHRYQVTERLILKEKYQDLATRLANARWIQATADERLTLVTCWPYETNTHRLFIIAEPVDGQVGGGELAPD